MDIELINNFISNEIYIWNLNIKTHAFKHLNFDDHNVNVQVSNFKKFSFLIKPCFRNYFLQVFENFECFLNDKTINKTNNQYLLEIILPIHLNHTHFTYCLLKIIPEIKGEKVNAFGFVLIPIKDYDDEAINVKVCHNLKKCEQATMFIKSRAYVKNIFTTAQEKVLFYLLKEENISTAQIANYLNKEVINIDRYNELIKDRLSHFFDINFKNLTDAIAYYKKCFGNIFLKDINSINKA